MRTKILELYQQHLQTIPEIKSPKALGYTLLQYCQAIAHRPSPLTWPT